MSTTQKVEEQSETLQVTNPYNGVEIGTVETTSLDQVESVLQRAAVGFEISRNLSRFERHGILSRAAALLEARQEEIAQSLVAEAGKTIRQARKEAKRAVNTMSLSAEVARSFSGEMIPFDASEGSENRKGWFTREPLGVIVAITPYNDALNLVVHKLGPAIAGGNSVILKPSDLTPLASMLLVDILVEAGMPEEVVTIVCGSNEVSQALIQDRSVRMVTFTGGFTAGEAIARSAGLKKIAMELGGNAPVLVFGDIDLQATVQSCVSGAFWAAGQNCVGTQRILIHRSLYQRFREEFISQTLALKVGDPTLEVTDVGPMITEEAAMRAQEIVASAQASGAYVLAGNRRKKSLFYPTVLENVAPSCSAWAEEVFAPIVVLESFETEEEAVELANHIEYSLHAAVFTKNIDRALRLSTALDAGGVMINDSSDYRVDSMPFGGSKLGSMGREGVRFAYEEMTQPKVVCINAG
jgi:acyl-CoA reductase-like NAD-dependent aldehyde dehydrogenase